MKKLWISFALVFTLSFAVLGWIGTRIYQQMPPIPAKVVSADGTVVVADGDVGRGQNVWQALGGMEVGSIWGHGSYVAPDWTADWLHREASFVLNDWSVAEFNSPYESLSAENQAKLQGRLQEMYRRNSYDPGTKNIVIDPVRARAFEACLAHFSNVFRNGEKAYAIPPGSVDTAEHMREFAGFIFWTAWAASSDRPNDTITYTNNWPYEPLVGNRPTGESVVWTGVSIIMLLAGISAMVWWYAARKQRRAGVELPSADPLGAWQATPSQKATLKYFWVVSALILVQMLLGVVTAHYGVEGDGFYGFPLSQMSAVQRDSDLARAAGNVLDRNGVAGGRIVYRPAGQRARTQGSTFGVNVLFGALLVVVAGSLTGEWLSIQHKLSDAVSFSSAIRATNMSISAGMANCPVRRLAALAVSGGSRGASGLKARR